MSEHLYKVVEVVGTSTVSWEKAVANIVEEMSKHLKDLRIGQIEQFDTQIVDGKVALYRAKVKVSFRYHPELHEKA